MSSVAPLFVCHTVPCSCHDRHEFTTVTKMQAWLFRNPKFMKICLKDVEIRFQTVVGPSDMPIICNMETLHFREQLTFSDLAVAQDLFSCLDENSSNMMKKYKLPDWFLKTKQGKPN